MQAFGLRLVSVNLSGIPYNVLKVQHPGSIHFSLLTGRILLKDVRYHSSNQTIKIVTGQIQWRYWTRYPTTEEEIESIRGNDSKA